MRLLLDYQVFTNQQYGGISKYFCEILHYFPKEVSAEIALKYSDNVHLKSNKISREIKDIFDPGKAFLGGVEFPGKGRLFKIAKSLWPERFDTPETLNQNLAIEFLKKCSFDIFHPTYYDDYFMDYIGRKPFVITIHDMIYEKFPEFFPLADKTIFKKKKLAQKASHIIAVSENTKKDIINFLDITEEKITVIYHGSPGLSNKKSKHLEYNFKYLLYVGARSGYKNFIFFIQSVASLLNRIDIFLICTGLPFSKDELKLLEYLEINERVINIFASESELRELYNNAEALIFPSLYEGFGIPILEAFANSCPVILSETACFREIAGDAGLYFDPKSRNEICEKIDSLLNSNHLKDEMKKKGIERSRLFTWTSAADKTFNVYQKCLRCQ